MVNDVRLLEDSVFPFEHLLLGISPYHVKSHPKKGETKEEWLWVNNVHICLAPFSNLFVFCNKGH